MCSNLVLRRRRRDRSESFQPEHPSREHVSVLCCSICCCACNFPSREEAEDILSPLVAATHITCAHGCAHMTREARSPAVIRRREREAGMTSRFRCIHQLVIPASVSAEAGRTSRLSPAIFRLPLSLCLLRPVTGGSLRRASIQMTGALPSSANRYLLSK